MAMERFDDDLKIIAGLGDDPKRDDGLSTQGFKSIFDKAGLLIQDFINNKLIPYIEKQNVGLPLGGGKMEGPINMNGQPLSGLNAPTKDDEAATKGYADELIRTAAPRNLLDNSYFANPVNQRGVTSWTPSKSGYWSLDRWVTYGAGTTFTLENKKVVISNDGSATCGFQQRIEEIALSAGKRYTLAVKGRVTGTWYLSFGENVGSNTDSKELDQNVDKVHVFCFTLPESTDGLYNFRIRSSANVATAEIEWMALYEGEYTIDTLPAYQPKGYGAELTECMRYYYRFDITGSGLFTSGRSEARIGIPLPIPMRITPTITNPEISFIRFVSGNTVSPTVTSVKITYNTDNSLSVSYIFSAISGETNNTPIAGYASGELSADL